MRTTFLWVTWRASSSSCLKRRSIVLRFVGIAAHLRAYHFQRDQHVQVGVPGLIHRSHAAHAKQLDDAVAGTEPLADRRADRCAAWACGCPTCAGGSPAGGRSRRPGRKGACWGAKPPAAWSGRSRSRRLRRAAVWRQCQTGPAACRTECRSPCHPSYLLHRNVDNPCTDAGLCRGPWEKSMPAVRAWVCE